MFVDKRFEISNLDLIRDINRISNLEEVLTINDIVSSLHKVSRDNLIIKTGVK